MLLLLPPINLLQNYYATISNASPEKHMQPALLRSMQRRVRKTRKELIIRELSVSGMVPESIGQLTEWCESMLLEHHLKRLNDLEDEYCLPLHQAFVLGHDIKDHRALIHFHVSPVYFALNALRCIETGWGNQTNGYATFGFCSSNVDMICLGFNSMGSVNNPACWSFIQHQVEGQLTYTVTFHELQKAVISLLKANTAKDCPFSSCIKDLLGRPNMQRYMRTLLFREGKLEI
jgi:hypothetical protein